MSLEYSKVIIDFSEHAKFYCLHNSMEICGIKLMSMSEAKFLLLTESEITRIVQNAVQNSFREWSKKTETDENEEVLDIKGAANLIKKAPKTIYKLVSQREIPHMKQGHHLVFFRKDLLEWLKSYKVKTAAEISYETENQIILQNRRRG